MNFCLISVAITTLFACSSALAGSIEIGKCCSIDGPANIREAPKGNITDSLLTDKLVRIIDKKDDIWYLVEYSSSDDQECPSSGKLKTGWTSMNNLVQVDTLGQFVKDNKVLVARRNLIFVHGDREKYFGNNLICKEFEKDQIYPEICKPTRPILLNVYCIDGKKYKNEISSVTFDFGADSSANLVEIETKYKLPSGSCILVNGRLTNSTEKSPPREVTSTDVCVKTWMKNQSNYFCNFKIGDLNNDGKIEIVVHEGDPFASFWKIYEIDRIGKVNLLGDIGRE